MARILIAEGEPLIASFVQRGLRANGYLTRVEHNPGAAVALAASGDFDLLILDLRLLGEAEVEMLARLRADGQAPAVLVLLSSGAPPSDALLGGEPVEALAKPFKFGDLVTRVRSVLQREGIAEPSVLRVGRSVLDLESRCLTVGDQTYQLSASEFALADALFRNAGRDLSLEQLAGHALEPLNGAAGSVEADFRRLREKLGNELLTVVGLVGYRLRGNGDC